MSNKRYYWLKLKDDFFDDDTISYIEEQENGKEYCLFYLKLCLKSLKTEGALIRHVGEVSIPYDARSLAKLTNTDIDTVAVAVKLFEKLKIISINDAGTIYLNQIDEMIGSESNKAGLMRKKRFLENQKGNNVPNSYQNVTKNVTPEKEKDREKDK
jgi:predicted phage replisome organizer